MIKLSGISKVYSTGSIEVEALKNIDLHIRAGELVSIMGPSGSGKSTMMNILGCLDTPTKGSYFLDGINVAQVAGDELARIRNSKIGFVFQGFNLLSRQTAMENVELPLIYAGVKPKDRKKLAREALIAVGLANRLEHHPKELSGGQQQRVAIARALVNNPAVILADEPTGNLDTHSSDEVMKIFQELNARGHTIIIVTHEPDIAQYTRRIVRFRDGKIEAIEDIGGLVVET